MASLAPDLISRSDAHRVRIRRLIATLALMLFAALVVVAPASAINPTLMDATPGAAAPAGLFRDSNDDIWVADAVAGICRLQVGSGLEQTAYCNPLGHTGPIKPGQSAFVPLTGDIYVGDGDSNAGGVWRLHINQAVNPSVIDGATKIVNYSVSRDRVFGMSYDALTDSLDFSTKNSATILRIQHPGPATCPASCPTIPLGAAQTNASPSLAHDGQGRLYITGGSSVTVLAPGDSVAHPVSGLNLGSYSALAFDPNHNRLYAGTTNTSGVDWIDVLNISTAETETYSMGFDGVTTIGVYQTHNGALDVIDDTCLKRTCEDGNRTRRFVVDFEDFAPAPQMVDWPLPVSNATIATFSYQYPSWTPFFCSLDQAPAIACGAGTQGSTMYPWLPNGVHTFVVYAGNAVSGARTIRRFVIDTRAPVVSIDTVTVSGSSVELGLSADDINVDFGCSLDGGAATPCDDPARYGGLADGMHTFAVHATDFVGNVGQWASTAFRIGVPPPAWMPGKITSTLRKTSLRVAFVAPPGAVFARFTLAVKSGATIRTKIVRVKAGTKNIVIIKLTRAQAKRLQRKPVMLTIAAGAVRTALTTKAGRGRLTIAARLTTTRGH